MRKIWYEIWLLDSQEHTETLLAKVKSPGLAQICKNNFSDIYERVGYRKIEIR